MGRLKRRTLSKWRRASPGCSKWKINSKSKTNNHQPIILMSKSVFCIATTLGQAERIVQQLQDQRFPASEISVLMPDTSGHHDMGHVKQTKAPEGTATGAATGGVTG